MLIDKFCFWRLFFDELYFLQLENFDLKRFWAIIIQRKNKCLTSPRRLSLVFTAKVKLLVALSGFLVALPLILFLWQKQIWWFLIFLIEAFFPFITLSLSLILMFPIDALVKKFLIFLAKRKIKSFPDLKIIGITGSFGKTTMKEMLGTVLAEKFRVQKTGGNVNTVLGVANFILSQLKSSTEVFLVEMGAYQKGDIAELCRLTPPDVAVLTGVNEAHLERFKTLANTLAAKLEIVSGSKKNALIAVNLPDIPMSIAKDKQIVFYNSPKSQLSVKNIHFSVDSLTTEFDLFEKNVLLAHLKTHLLGDYAARNAAAVFAVSKFFKLSLGEFTRGFEKIQPLPHRLQPQINPEGKFIVIDDAYNGNPEGVRAAVRILASFPKNRWRRIFFTPGLVEMGRRKNEVHEEIGHNLASVADLVILIKNSATPSIEKGLLAAGFDPVKIIWFSTPQAAFANLKNLLRANDVLLIQNDWPENYW